MFQKFSIILCQVHYIALYSVIFQKNGYILNLVHYSLEKFWLPHNQFPFSKGVNVIFKNWGKNLISIKLSCSHQNPTQISVHFFFKVRWLDPKFGALWKKFKHFQRALWQRIQRALWQRILEFSLLKWLMDKGGGS